MSDEQVEPIDGVVRVRVEGRLRRGRSLHAERAATGRAPTASSETAARRAREQYGPTVASWSLQTRRQRPCRPPGGRRWLKQPGLSIGRPSSSVKRHAPWIARRFVRRASLDVSRLCEAARATWRGPTRSGRTCIAEPRMMLIGQAPGPVTDRKGYHFAGPAGRFLEVWLGARGVPRGLLPRARVSDLAHALLPRQVAVRATAIAPPSRAEIALCRPFLDRELELLQPKRRAAGRQDGHRRVHRQAPLVDTVGRVFERRRPPFLPLPHASGVSRAGSTCPRTGRCLDQALAS